MRFRMIATIVSFAFTVFAGVMRAQQTSGTFLAVVTDSTGGPVPEAAVTLTHDGTGLPVTSEGRRSLVIAAP